MLYKSTLGLFAIICFSLSFSVSQSYSLTESVDLFGQINSADLILNDIWIEPKNPRNGEALTVHGSIYNAGVVPSGEVSNVVTVGYFVNEELVEIAVLENILPGIENGVEISSGPIFDAIPGNYIVTVIVNYHDTLSHLRDNPENNIVQKNFQIGNDVPSLINFDIYQYYNNKTGNQEIIIKGQVTDIFQEKVKDQKVIIDIEGYLQSKTITDLNGEFYFETYMPFKKEIVEITTYLEDSSSFSSHPQAIFPIKLNKEQSILAVEIAPDAFTDNFKNSSLTLVFFQDSYDNMFKKISTDDYNQNLMLDNFFLTVLPANHKYIVEVYIEGRILDAFQNYFSNSTVIKKEIFISESAQVQFRIVNEVGEPQSGVIVDNWIYSTSSDENGLTEWIELLPTFTANEPYVAKATFPNGVVWSEPFLIEAEEKKVIKIIQRGYER